jgi:hypothetical protein
VCNVRDFNRAFLVGVLRISTGYFLVEVAFYGPREEWYLERSFYGVG